MLDDVNSTFRATLYEGIRFAIVGGTGLVANLLLMVVIVEVISAPEEFAAVLSTLLVLVGGFVATNWWVFTGVERSDTTQGLVKRGLSYYAIMLSSKAINYGIYLLLLSVGVWYPLAWFVGSVIVFAGTFTSNRLVWYRTK